MHFDAQNMNGWVTSKDNQDIPNPLTINDVVSALDIAYQSNNVREILTKFNYVMLNSERPVRAETVEQGIEFAERTAGLSLVVRPLIEQ